LEIINIVLGVPLGYIIYFIYNVTGNYGFSVIIFSVFIRLFVIFPISIVTQKNAIRLLILQPDLRIIKRRYAGDKERLNEEQYNLFKKERYNPFIGLIPLVVQLILMIGIMQVVLNPMRHMHGINLNEINFTLLGLDLLSIPSFVNPSPELIIPFLSFVVALGFCLVQNAISPGALSQSKSMNIGLTVFTVALSLYLTMVLPVGVGLYWTVSNLVAIAIVVLLNLLYNPKKLAPEALSFIESTKKTPVELKLEKETKKILSVREKQDALRFTKADKKLVFYAISSGQYKYYKTVIDYILENSDITIHYLTNDPNDSLFKKNEQKLQVYYVSQLKSISLFLKLDTDIMVTTVPDLGVYHMKRSVVRDDIEYIYMYHGLTSGHLVLRESAFDYFNSIFCVGPHHVNEVRRREELASLPVKNLVKAGYGMYDQLVESYVEISGMSNDIPQVLIAPSWQSDNIMELCINDVLDALLGRGYRIIVRPHPQYVNIYSEYIAILKEKYVMYESAGEIIFELDFSDSSSIYRSDILITDWSNIAYEFSYCTLKPSVFINTPMKIMNPNYKQYNLEVLDISLRDKLGVSVNIDKINELGDVIAGLLNESNMYKNKISDIVKQYLYYPGRSGKAGGMYITNKLNG